MHPLMHMFLFVAAFVAFVATAHWTTQPAEPAEVVHETVTMVSEDMPATAALPSRVQPGELSDPPNARAYPPSGIPRVRIKPGVVIRTMGSRKIVTYSRPISPWTHRQAPSYE